MRLYRIFNFCGGSALGLRTRSHFWIFFSTNFPNIDFLFFYFHFTQMISFRVTVDRIFSLRIGPIFFWLISCIIQRIWCSHLNKLLLWNLKESFYGFQFIYSNVFAHSKILKNLNDSHAPNSKLTVTSYTPFESAQPGLSNTGLQIDIHAKLWAEVTKKHFWSF